MNMQQSLAIAMCAFAAAMAITNIAFCAMLSVIVWKVKDKIVRVVHYAKVDVENEGDSNDSPSTSQNGGKAYCGSLQE